MSTTTTAIAWTDATWNPLRGCARVSSGCEHCDAERQAGRFSGAGKAYAGLVRKMSGGWRWTGEVRLIEHELYTPLRWQRPRRVCVNSMSDCFHEAVAVAWLEALWAVMATCPQHTFQILTKRPEQMRRWVDRWGDILPNVWLGVSVEDQATADTRIPWLLRTPAAVRFVSYEPALGPVDFTAITVPESVGVSVVDTLTCDDDPDDCGARGTATLDWLICGGESGPGARPCDLAWLRSVVAQCAAAGVPCFVKQLGRFPIASRDDFPAHSRGTRRPHEALGGPCLRSPAGADPAEWPADLRVQQWPEGGTP